MVPFRRRIRVLPLSWLNPTPQPFRAETLAARRVLPGADLAVRAFLHAVPFQRRIKGALRGKLPCVNG